MTHIFFVRHAEPVHSWKEDCSRPLSELGKSDCIYVTDFLRETPVDMFISSPYKRSIDTISEAAAQHGMQILTDERLREREQGEGYISHDMIRRRWADFNYHEPGGESIGMVQKRNIEALSEILSKNQDKRIVIGTHGTALASILNHYAL